MVLSVTFVLALVALLLVVGNIVQRIPLWPAVLVLAIALLVGGLAG